TNEIQSIALNYDVSDPANPPPTFQLTLPTNASGISGTTGDIAIVTKLSDPTDPTSALVLDSAKTSTNIQTALDNALFGGPKTGAGTRVFFDTTANTFKVVFAGIDNVDLPTMT